MPKTLDLAGVGHGKAEQHVDRCRLAGAVRAQQGDGLARGDVDVDAAHGPDGSRWAAERLDQTVHGDAGDGGCGRCHGASLLRPVAAAKVPARSSGP